MATVYVVTAGSGDTYRIERVYLDSDEAYRFEEEYNGNCAQRASSGRGMGGGCPTGGLRRPVLAGPVVGACASQ